MIRHALVGALVVSVVTLTGAQEKPAVDAFRLTTSACTVTVALNGRVTHTCASMDEASELFWQHVSRLGLLRNGQVVEALELAVEFVRDPDEALTQDAVYRTQAAQLRGEADRLDRRAAAAKKIREALALLKETRQEPSKLFQPQTDHRDEPETPTYMRVTADTRKLNMALGEWIDESGRGVVRYILNRDIDVSTDEKTWFHLFGSPCLRRLRDSPLPSY